MPWSASIQAAARAAELAARRATRASQARQAAAAVVAAASSCSHSACVVHRSLGESQPAVASPAAGRRRTAAEARVDGAAQAVLASQGACLRAASAQHAAVAVLAHAPHKRGAVGERRLRSAHVCGAHGAPGGGGKHEVGVALQRAGQKVLQRRVWRKERGRAGQPQTTAGRGLRNDGGVGDGSTGRWRQERVDSSRKGRLCAVRAQQWRQLRLATAGESPALRSVKCAHVHLLCAHKRPASTLCALAARPGALARQRSVHRRGRCRWMPAAVL